MTKISQREARQLRKRVTELEKVLKDQKDRWSSDWGPSWVSIETIRVTETSFAKIRTARLLNHAVIVLPDNGTDILRFYAEAL